MQRTLLAHTDIFLTSFLYLLYAILVLHYSSFLGTVRLFWLLFNACLLRLAWQSEELNKCISTRVNLLLLAYALSVLLSTPLLFYASGRTFFFLLQSLFSLPLLGYALALRNLSASRIL